MKTYKCSICGRKNVKLWRPFDDAKPLICAICAEKRQVRRKIDECSWEEKDGCMIGTPTGKKLSLGRWIVDDLGHISAPIGPGPGTTPAVIASITDQLVINLKDILDDDDAKEKMMVPAIPDGDNEFFDYFRIPESEYEDWQRLPTRR